MVSRPLKCGADFLDFVALDDVADLVAVEIVELDPALKAGANFAGVVLEAFERADLALVNGFLAAAKTGGGVAIDLALGDKAAGDEAFRERKRGADFRGAGFGFLEVG